MSNAKATIRLIIERMPGFDGIDLLLPSDDLEIIETLSGRILRLALPTTHPCVELFHTVPREEPIVIALRDGLGQRLFRGIRIHKKHGERTDCSTEQFAFALNE